MPNSVWRRVLRGAGMGLCLALAVCASARDADGRLSVIRAPHNAAPAVLLPGATFHAILEEEAALKLTDSERTVTLAVEWTPADDGRWLAECHAPDDTPPGVYTLEAETDEETDRNQRAVYIWEELPDVYLVAHVADPMIGAQDGDAAERFSDAIEDINASPAELLLVSGQLTADDQPEQFERVFELIDAAHAPTVVCPVPGVPAADYFHDRAFVFRFGRDAFLVFDETPLLDANHPDRFAARLYRYRREIKPARWSIGLTGHYSQRQNMRAQIALFIDDPLSMLIAAQRGDPEESLEYAFPWGGASVAMAPSLETGAVRFIEVAPNDLNPREPEELPLAEETENSAE